MTGTSGSTTISSDLLELLKTAGTPEDFKKFLTAEKLFLPRDIALITAKEDELDEKLIKGVEAVVTLGNIGERNSIKYLWELCRDYHETCKANVKL